MATTKFDVQFSGVAAHAGGKPEDGRNALLAAAQAGLEIAEYTPNHIKKAVVGVGHAEKGQVQAMVKRLLPACKVTSPDAADALAAAIAHAALAGTRAKIAKALA